MYVFVTYSCFYFILSFKFQSFLFFFFFLMIRRPPSSTLFPTRRSSDLPSAGEYFAALVRKFSTICSMLVSSARITERSEEHTSELQSRRDLVCRLLLEKKKQIRNQIRITQQFR